MIRIKRVVVCELPAVAAAASGAVYHYCGSALALSLGRRVIHF
jgi:hypothetical protein